MNKGATEQFIRDLEDNYASSIATIKLKNNDYASPEDPFRNFREAAQFAGVPVERAMLVRIGDKVARYRNILDKEELDANAGVAVADETVEDTLRDLLGYINILATYREWKKKPVEGYLYSGTDDNYEVELVPEEQAQEEELPQDFFPIDVAGQAPPEAEQSPEAKSAAQRLRDLLRLPRG